MATYELSRSQNGNLTRVYVGDLVLWFSYETIVAFHAPGGPRRVCENVWSQTTSKHLSEIDGGDKSSRVPREEFLQLLETATSSKPVTTFEVPEAVSGLFYVADGGVFKNERGDTLVELAETNAEIVLVRADGTTASLVGGEWSTGFEA